jgi:adenylate kinase
MDCSADTMTNRLLQRNQSSQHVDDTTKTIAKRLETYYRASIPVMAYYETKTKLQKVSHTCTPHEPVTIVHLSRENAGKFCLWDLET